MEKESKRLSWLLQISKLQTHKTIRGAMMCNSCQQNSGYNPEFHCERIREESQSGKTLVTSTSRHDRRKTFIKCLTEKVHREKESCYTHIRVIAKDQEATCMYLK